MGTPFIRNGRMVGNPLPAGKYDINKLDQRTTQAASEVFRKATENGCLTVEDANTILRARKAARVAPGGDTLVQLREQIARLREVLR